MNFWYAIRPRSWIAYLLLPFSLLFWLLTVIRKSLFRFGIMKSYRAPVPVIVVGNLSVGGNGKTPVVIWLEQQLQQRNIKCGVISRGYGSRAESYPLLVSGETNPVQGGDEPVLIVKRTGVAVCISPDRRQAIELLLKNTECDLIISDDGLQHYKLQRDVEIVVMDAERGLGNGFPLPAGPLRELPNRLNSVDLIIANGSRREDCDALMTLNARFAVNLVSGEKCPLSEFHKVSAVAGIGNPQRFFTMLRGLNIELTEVQPFQDHQQFTAELFTKFSKNQPLFMTEKDAVKCVAFAQPNWWYVPVEAEIIGDKVASLLDRISEMKK